MAEIYILNSQDHLITTLSEETGLQATHFREELNGLPDQPFSFTINAEVEEAKYVLEENQVVFKDKEGELRLFVIKELDDSDDASGAVTTAFCEPAFMELKENIIVDSRFVNRPALEVLTVALQGTRWTGTVEVELGQYTTNFYYETSIGAIWTIMEIWGGEFKDTVEFNGNKITARKIRILARRGLDSGKRFEIGYNMQEIQRTILSYPTTAIYGRGSSLNNDSEGDNEDVALTRYLDFADVVWSKSSGDPVDKPAGQKWVGDPDALQKYGREHNGQLLHREAEWQNGDYDDPAELLKATWEQLQRVKGPEINYRLAAHMLEVIAGYEHEKVSLGDTARAIDRKFSRPIEIQARVIAMEYDLLDIEESAVVEMGQVLSVHGYDDRLDKVVRQINDNRGKWDEAARPIDGSRYPNIVPSVPQNVKVTGLFAAVLVEWDFDYILTYIQGYEVYASEVKGFLPSPETMIFRGMGNSFSYTFEPNKQLYFRVRAFNYHDRFSLYSQEVTAMTARIISDDILFGPEIAAELRELSKTAQVIADESLSGKELVDGSIISDKIAKGVIEMEHLKPGIIDLDKFADDTLEEIRKTVEGYTEEEINRITKELRDELDDKVWSVDLVKLEEALRSDLATKAGLELVDGKFKFTDAKLLELDQVANELVENVGDINGEVTGIKVDVDEAKNQLELQADKLSNQEGILSSHSNKLTINEAAINARLTKTEFNTEKGSLAQSIGKVDAKVDSFSTDFTRVENSVQGLSEQQSRFETSIGGLSNKVSDVTTKTDGNTSDITAVRSRTSSLEQRTDRFSISLENLETDMEDMAPTTGDNMLPDGGFEGGGKGWISRGSNAVTEDDPNSGNKAMRFFAQNGSTNRADTILPIPVKAGRTYQFSFCYKTHPEANGTRNNQKLSIRNAENTNQLRDWGWDGAQDEWAEIQERWTCPEGVTSITIWLVANHTRGWVQYDDVSMVDVTNIRDLQERTTRTETSIQILDGQIALKASQDDLSKKVDAIVYNNRQSALDLALSGIRGNVTDVTRKVDTATGDITILASRTGELELSTTRFSTTISSIESKLDNKLEGETVRTTGSGGSNGGNWTRFARTTLTSRYNNVYGIVDIVGGDHSASTGDKTTIYIRHKQQEAIGGPTIAEIAVTDSKGRLRTEDFKAVVVQNSGNVVVEYYLRVRSTYQAFTLTSYSIYKSNNNNGFQLLPNQGFVPNVPIGSQNIDGSDSDTVYGRIVKAETEIVQTKDEIALRATKTEVNHLTGRVTTAEGRIITQAGQISARVERDKLVAELNIQPESVKIKAGLIHLAGQSRIDNAVIQNAHINNLSGDKIQANTISSSKLFVADMSNVNQISVDGDRGGHSVSNISGTNFFRISGRYGKLLLAKARQMDFSLDDEYYLSFFGMKDPTISNVNWILRYRYTDGTWENAAVTNSQIGTTRSVCVRTFKVTVQPNKEKTIQDVEWFLEKDESDNNGSFYVRDIVVRQMSRGELIVDGSIEAKHLRADTIKANSGVIARAAIGTASIANAAITRVHLQNAIIGNAQIENGVITNAKIGNGAIDNAKIANASITSAKISSIDAGKINAGVVTGLQLRSSDGSSTFQVQGARLRMDMSNGRNLTIDETGIYFRHANGVMAFQATTKVINSYVFGTSDTNAYLACFNESRSVTYETAMSGNGRVEDYLYQPHRAQGFYGNFLNFNAGTPGVNIYLRPDYDAEVRCTRTHTIDRYCDMRVWGLHTTRIDSNGLGINTGGHPHIHLGASGEVRIAGGPGRSDSYGTLRTDWVHANHIAINGHTAGTHLYLRPSGNNSEVRIRDYGNDDYRDVRARRFFDSSSKEFKTNIKPIKDIGLSELMKLTVVEYNWKDKLVEGINEKEIGFIAEDSPFIATPDLKAIDSYQLRALNTKSIQELHKRQLNTQSQVDQLNQKISELENEIHKLKSA
ncbi:phage tail spike protein [Alkalicoccobacillus murimartini]|uniref:Phage minor structural protein n=1 Tax=Alkalicoccobacillus murimartini TaxID=171685 RepID=A0ABT9YFN4_9BACI|nr:phage tail spike protein [Alkalicoccobacillus murimartini]MDQ0206663.1 phage minor structural protein [Alkalicoccobacillus murimartini]